MEVKSASIVVEDPRYSEGWSASLRLSWRLSSSLAANREATIRLKGSAARLFSEAGSSIDRRLLSLITSLSLGPEGTVLAYCCSG